MKFIGIIPARYASTRFPGKPLAVLGGKPVIQRVYEQVVSVLGEAYVATDDERIFQAVEQFGGKAVMTRNDHKSGTDRIEEAAQKANFVLTNRVVDVGTLELDQLHKAGEVGIAEAHQKLEALQQSILLFALYDVVQP